MCVCVWEGGGGGLHFNVICISASYVLFSNEVYFTNHCILFFVQNLPNKAWLLGLSLQFFFVVAAIVCLKKYNKVADTIFVHKHNKTHNCEYECQLKVLFVVVVACL